MKMFEGIALLNLYKELLSYSTNGNEIDEPAFLVCETMYKLNISEVDRVLDIFFDCKTKNNGNRMLWYKTLLYNKLLETDDGVSLDTLNLKGVRKASKSFKTRSDYYNKKIEQMSSYDAIEYENLLSNFVEQLLIFSETELDSSSNKFLLILDIFYFKLLNLLNLEQQNALNMLFIMKYIHEISPIHKSDIARIISVSEDNPQINEVINSLSKHRYATNNKDNQLEITPLGTDFFLAEEKRINTILGKRISVYKMDPVASEETLDNLSLNKRFALVKIADIIKKISVFIRRQERL